MSFLSALKSFFGLGAAAPKLQPGDRMLVCDDCKSNFVFDVGEQNFFRSKGFTEPKRCPNCRKSVRSRMRRRGRGRRHGGGGDHGQQGGHQGHGQQQHPPHSDNRHNSDRRDERRHDRHRDHRHSVIDGDSPYADER